MLRTKQTKKQKDWANMLEVETEEPHSKYQRTSQPRPALTRQPHSRPPRSQPTSRQHEFELSESEHQQEELDDEEEEEEIISSHGSSSSRPRLLMQSEIGVSSSGQRIFQVATAFRPSPSTETASSLTTTSGTISRVRPDRFPRSKVAPVAHGVDIQECQIHIPAFKEFLKLPTYKGNK